MIEILADLPDEKRNRILNASMKEFVSMGYKKASTNAIVEEAGISKGALFKYFGSKKQLFLNLFEYGNALIEEDARRSGALDTDDILKRMELLFKSMASTMESYPLALDFIRVAKTDGHPDISGEVKEIKSRTTHSLLDRLLEDLDYSLFRNGADPEKCVYVIQAVLMSKTAEYMHSGAAKDFSIFLDEISAFLCFFRDVFYK